VMFFQNTLKTRVEVEGIGIHSGEISRVSLVPAPVNTGIVFLPYVNEEPSTRVKAHINNLLFTNNAITIGNDLINIQTIEHFMATFYAYDITNLYVLVKGNELPILDGSAKEIVDAIERAGIYTQNAFYEVFYIPYPIWVENDGRYLIAIPSNEFKITYTIDFTSKSNAIGTQTAHFTIDKGVFKEAIAPARTFGFSEDLDQLKTNNLALGGSLENALLFTRDGLVNDNLRFTNECVRHKILDLIGDLALAGYKMKGHFMAHKSGHSMDTELVRKINKLMKRKQVSRNISHYLLRKKEMEFNRFKRKMNLM
jgi:UDP-3-O-[3-hydroxymyristoyl] N-acetylglucosamine deacetylase